MKNVQPATVKSIDVRTEILIPTEQSRKEKRIRKKIIFRCTEHINLDVNEMLERASLKSRSQ